MSKAIATNPARICIYGNIYLIVRSFRTLGRPRRRWRDNIKMNLLEIGLGDVVMDIRVP
jgi:hypothetical protein